MRVITAPELYKRTITDFVVFLAGGISKCPDWQKEVIDYLNQIDKVCFPSAYRWSMQELIICNPRRDNFPIDDPDASKEQIEWEYKWLNECDLITMNFCESESDQPICMYELGQYVLSPGRILEDETPPIINTSSKYKRYNDVLIQTDLVSNGRIYVNVDMTMREYAIAIYSSYLIRSEAMRPSFIKRLLNSSVFKEESK